MHADRLRCQVFQLGHYWWLRWRLLTCGDRATWTALLPIKYLTLEELKVLAENLEAQALQIDSLSARLVYAKGLLLNFFVFKDDKLLDLEHLITEPLDSDKLLVGLRGLDFKKDLQDVVVLVLHLDQAQFLLLVLTDKADELTALFDFVQTLDELVRETFDPLDVFVLNFDEGVTNSFLPLSNDRNVWLVFDNRFRCVRFNLLELLQLALVLLVDVVQVLGCNDALQTLV